MSKHANYVDNPHEWLNHVAAARAGSSVELLEKAILVYEPKDREHLEKGLKIADILFSLELDNETLAAAILYPALTQHLTDVDHVAEHFGESSRKLLRDISQLQTLHQFRGNAKQNGEQIENLRKMLLAMVGDVRAVLFILAERLWQLRAAKNLPVEMQYQLAKETHIIYAPLANRLGVWQLKWEIEDLCLRYLEPDAYTSIAKWLASKRVERESYIKNMITQLQHIVSEANIQEATVTGRVKHIYSIYKKMQRKNASFDQIFDISALRVLVPTIDDCYTVLSLIANTWQQVPEEFDDYIANPKPNGYRSIHTVIIGPVARFIEIQIRTQQMHQESELGVAAHWRYKEGVLQTANYDAKIALLRQVMAWQREVSNENTAKSDQAVQDLFADRIYVFTPTGDIIDLPQGATPLDFAYLIHSEVGHRCRGAKVNGVMVPLTHALQTGARVEILTAKQASPSRDWLNPHYGYVKTSRARAKIQHWFRVHDSEQHAIDGRELLEKEFKKAGLHDKIDLQAIALKYHFKHESDLLAAIAQGEVRVSQIIQQIAPPKQAIESAVQTRPAQKKPDANIQILGINNLLTNLAKCCKPLPGDDVIGYISLARGVTIHKRHCRNILQIKAQNKHRLVEVSWGEKQTTHTAHLRLRAYDRAELMRDITSVLATEKINITAIQAQAEARLAEITIYLTIEINTNTQLMTAIQRLQQVQNILEVKRR